jgi:hypothetical protein
MRVAPSDLVVIVIYTAKPKRSCDTMFCLICGLILTYLEDVSGVAFAL